MYIDDMKLLLKIKRSRNPDKNDTNDIQSGFRSRI